LFRISQLESELEEEQATNDTLLENHRKTLASLEAATAELSQERGQVNQIFNVGNKARTDMGS